jgi:hypothetical protein
MNAPLYFKVYEQRPSSWLLACEPRSPEDSSASQPAQTIAEPEKVADWKQVHEHLLQLRKNRAAHERDVCRWLCAAERLGAHACAGYASLCEYADRLIGLSARETEERLRVGRAISLLPLLDAALASGQLRWSVVRELTRVATPDSEAAWLGWAKGKRSRQIEKAVAGRRKGDGPTARFDPALEKHVLRFEVRAETMALFRDLQASVRKDLGSYGGPVDDDALLFEIARRALGGSEDEGRASYQVAVTRCDECGQSSIDAGGQSQPLDQTVAEMVACDSQHVGSVDDPQVHSPHPGAAAPHVDRPRATQTIPPAIRRQVMRRDRKRCVVNGCTNHRFLDVHHLDPRAEGGGHDPEKMGLLCGAHHRAAHAGQSVMEGTASTGFIFRHADRTSYGAELSPVTTNLAQQAFAALETMGFKQTQARALVDAVLRAGPPHDLAAFVHAALRGS